MKSKELEWPSKVKKIRHVNMKCKLKCKKKKENNKVNVKKWGNKWKEESNKKGSKILSKNREDKELREINKNNKDVENNKYR